MEVNSYYLLGFKEFTGLICATFTDMIILSGPSVDKCFYRYGVSRVKTSNYSEVCKLTLFDEEIFLERVKNCPLFYQQYRKSIR